MARTLVPSPAPPALSSKAPPLFLVRDLQRVFEDGAVPALRGVNLEVRPGESIAVQGPSGCGKSTLLAILGLLDEPTAGEVLFRGRPLRTIRDPAGFRARTIGFVFQSFHLLPTLTALENVQIPMLETGWPRRQRRSRAAELLEAVGLGGRLTQLPGKLSGGERQRVAVARSLANEPEVLLADEPTGNLDSAAAGQVMELLGTVSRGRGMTMIIVTHDPAIARHATRIVRMRDGRVLPEDGSAEAAAWSC